MNKLIMLLSIGALLNLCSCGKKEEVKEEEGKFTVTNPAVLDTAFTKEYVSQIKSVRNIEIRAQEKGYLQNIYVDEGQSVAAGQLLFRIMPGMYQAELLKAEAEAKIAKQTHSVRPPRFLTTYCSQCGGSMGPGNHGFSHCADHVL